VVGGTIIDIVKVSDHKWWVNCADNLKRQRPDQCAIYLDPIGEPVEVGDALWWQGAHAMWTPAAGGRSDVKLPRIGFSGVAHPHLPRCSVCGCTLEFCRRHGGCEETVTVGETHP